MKVTQYPTQVWVLQPSFKPKQVTLFREYRRWNNTVYHQAEGGKTYADNEVCLTQAEAILQGEHRLAKQQADLDKKQETLNKRKAVLDKAKEQSA